MKAAGQDTIESAVKIRSWQEVQKDFIRQTGLKRQNAREQITNYGRTEARNVTYEEKVYYKLWSKSIGVNDAIETLAKYYKIKYTDKETYRLLRQYVYDVQTGWISPNADFGNYLRLYNRIQNEIVGTETQNGILIQGQSKHFMQRVLGTREDSGHGDAIRLGVSVEDIKAALQTGTVSPVKCAQTPNSKPSQKYTTGLCEVSVNPDTGVLIQCNPKSKKGKKK